MWDRIVPFGAPGEAVERWGGIGYAVAASSAALGDGWSVRPIVKVGADLGGAWKGFLAEIGGVDLSGTRVVPEPTNRVELRYRSEEERTEVLTGGVPGWSWPELQPLIQGCDAVLVNFVSGFEAGRGTIQALRDAFDGPLYGDLHSLFLGIRSDGTRVPRPLEGVEGWARCFDILQLNEEEAGLAVGRESRPEEVALSWGPSLCIVTRGGRGVQWASAPGVAVAGDGDVRAGGILPLSRSPRERGRVVRGSVTIPSARAGDPTGCGDVWGGAFFGRLLLGDGIETAAELATRCAARKVGHRGADGLYQLLRDEVLS